MTPPAAYPPGTPEWDIYEGWRDSVTQGMWITSWDLLLRLAEPDLQAQPETARVAMFDGVLEGARMLGLIGARDGLAIMWEQGQRRRDAEAKAAS